MATSVNKTWGGGASTWATAAQWRNDDGTTSAAIPATTATATINGGTCTVAAQTIANLNIGGNCTIAGTSLTVTGNLYVAGGATLTFSGSGALTVQGNLYIDGAIQQTSATGSLLLSGAGNVEARFGSSNFTRVNIAKTAIGNTVTFTTDLYCEYVNSTTAGLTFTSGTLNQNGKTIYTRTLNNSSSTARNWYMNADVWIRLGVTGQSISANQTTCTYTNRDGLIRTNGVVSTQTMSFGSGVPATCPRLYLDNDVTYSISGSLWDFYPNGTHTATTTLVVFNELADNAAVNKTYTGMTLNRVCSSAGGSLTTNCTTRFGTISFYGAWTTGTTYTGAATHNIDFCRANTISNQAIAGCTWNFNSIEIGSSFTSNSLSTGTASTVYVGYARPISGVTATTNTWGASGGLVWNYYIEDWDVPGAINHGAGNLYIGYNTGNNVYTTNFVHNTTSRAQNFGSWWGQETWIVTKSNQPSAPTTGVAQLNGTNFTCNSTNGGWRLVGTGGNTFGTMNTTTQVINVRVAGSNVTISSGTIAYLGIEDGGTITAASTLTINKGNIYRTGESPGTLTGLSLTLTTSDSYNYNFDRRIGTVTAATASQTWTFDNVMCNTLNLNGVGCTYHINGATVYTAITVSTTAASAATTVNYNGGTTVALNMNTNVNNIHNFNGSFATTGICTFNIGTLNLNADLVTGSFVSASGSTRTLYWGQQQRIWSSGTGGVLTLNNNTGLTYSAFNGDGYWAGGYVHGGTGAATGLAWTATVPSMRWNTWHNGSGTYSTWYTQTFRALPYSTCTGASSVFITGDFYAENGVISLNGITLTQLFNSGTIQMDGDPINIASYTHAIADSGIQYLNRLIATNITLSGARTTYYLGGFDGEGLQLVKLNTNGTLTCSGIDAYYGFFRVRGYNVTMTTSGTNTLQVEVWDYQHNRYGSTDGGATFTGVTGGLWTQTGGKLRIKSGNTLDTYAYTLVNNVSITNKEVIFEGSSYIRSNGTGYLDWRYEPAAVGIDCSNNDSGMYHNGTSDVRSTGTPTSIDGMFNVWIAKTSTVGTNGVAVRNLTILEGGSINSPYTCQVSRDFTGYTNNTMSSLTVTQFLGTGTINYTGKGVAAYNHTLADQGTVSIQNIRAYTITLSGARNTYEIGGDSTQYLQISATGTLTLSGIDSTYNLYRVRSYNTSTSGSNVTQYINIYNYEHNYYNSSNVFAFDQTNPTGGTFTHSAGQLTIKSGYRLITWSYTLVSNVSITNRAVTFEENSFIKSLNTGTLDWRYEPTTTAISCSSDNAGFLHYGTGAISSTGSATVIDAMFNIWIYSLSSVGTNGAAVRNLNIVDGGRINSPYTVYVSKDWTGYTSQTMSSLTVQQFLGGGNITYTGSPVAAYNNPVANITQTMQYCPAINITLSGTNSTYYLGNANEGTYVQLPTNGTITLSGNAATYYLLRVRGYNLTLSGTGATYNCYEYSHNRYAADPPTAGTATHTAGTLVMKSGYTLGTWSFTSISGIRGITFEDNSWIYTENTGALTVNYTTSAPNTMTAVCAETNCGFKHGSTGAWQIGPNAPASATETFNFQWYARSTVGATSWVKCFANMNPWGEYDGVGGSGLINNTTTTPTVNVSSNLYLAGNQFSPGSIGGDSRWQYLALALFGAEPARVATFYSGWGQFGEGTRTLGTLTLPTTFLGTLKLGNYFPVYSVSHQGGTINLNGTQLYVESSYTSTDSTVGKSITTTATGYTVPGIYINATTGTPWQFNYTDQLYSDWRVWVYVRGGTVSHGTGARQSINQPSFDLTERVNAYTLAPTTDFRVGGFKINNYTVPTNSVWSIGGMELTVYTGGLSAPVNFTVNIIDGGNSKTATQLYVDRNDFAWPQFTISTNAAIACANFKFKNIYIDAGTTTSSGQFVEVAGKLGTSGGSGATLNVTNSTWVFRGSGTVIDYGFLGAGIFIVSDDLTGIFQFEGLNGSNLGDQYAGFGTNFGGKIINNISYNSITDVGTLFLEAGFSTNTALPLAGQIDVGYNNASFSFRSDHPGGNGFPIKGSTFNLGKNATKRLRSYGGNWGNKGLYNTEASSVVDLDYLDLTDCYAKGGGGWYAGPNSTDRGGNTGTTGWYFYSPATFSLSRSAASVDEGSNVTITLTTNAPNGSVIPYTITGVTSADISGASLTGNFTVSGGTASVVLNIAADYTTEGSETLTLSLNNGAASISIIVNDTSLLPTYSLSRSAVSVTEGGSFTISLATTNLPNGFTVPYTITGVSSSDINNASLTGNFTISGNSASLVVNTTWDYVTEGQETFTLTINPTYGTGSSISVAINNLLHPTYALAASPTTLDEGGNFTITLTTTDVPDNTTVPYTITGTVSSADINGASLTGNFTVVSNTASVAFTTTADYVTEDTEDFVLTLNTIGTVVAVTIYDYYKTRTYSLSTSATTVTEGDGFVITLTTTNVFNGTTVPYTITGVSTGDINNASLTGNFTITSNSGTQSFTTTIDNVAEGTETFTLSLGSPASGSINVSIKDPVSGGTGNFLSFFD